MKVTVDKSLTFDFPKEFEVLKWDDGEVHKRLSRAWQFACLCGEWPSHTCTKKTRKKSSCPRHLTCKVSRFDGFKAVDLVCRKGGDLYLVEVKDFNPSPKAVAPDFNQDHVLSHYVMSVAKKFRDTVFALFCGSFMSDPAVRAEAGSARRMRTNVTALRFVFHFESPKAPYKTSLFPSGKVISCATMKEALAGYLGSDLTAWLSVVDCATLQSAPRQLPWTVQRSRKLSRGGRC